MTALQWRVYNDYTLCEELNKWTEVAIAELHGMGPTGVKMLSAIMKK